MIGRRTLLIAAAAVAAGIGKAAAEPKTSILPLGFLAAEMRGPGTRVSATVGSADAFRSARPALAGPLVTVWGKDGGAVLTADGQGGVTVRRAARGWGDFPALERDRDAIPGSRVAAFGPFTASLAGPTRAYPHEALGSGVQAERLVVAERLAPVPGSDPKPVARHVVRIEAGTDAVFEDREPHLARLEGENTPAILLVRSDRQRGSAMVLVRLGAQTWSVAAETPPDGEPFRWLNPIGALGTGNLIALVRRPHLDGLLQVWRLVVDRLELVAEKPGYANHVFGSPAQDLAAILPPARPGGAPRIAVPTLDRTAVAILSVSGGTIAEDARVALPGRVALGVATLGEGADLHVLAGLEDGQVVDIRP